MINTILIFLGASLGGVFRYWISNSIHWFARRISGFGETVNHTASLIDLSLDLPLAIEFFDNKDKIESALVLK